jgi:hypothetical protein
VFGDGRQPLSFTADRAVADPGKLLFAVEEMPVESG